MPSCGAVFLVYHFMNGNSCSLRMCEKMGAWQATHFGATTVARQDTGTRLIANGGVLPRLNGGEGLGILSY